MTNFSSNKSYVKHFAKKEALVLALPQTRIFILNRPNFNESHVFICKTRRIIFENLSISKVGSLVPNIEQYTAPPRGKNKYFYTFSLG